MRYRNLILGAIIGAVIGAIFGAFFGAFNGASIGSISSLTGGFAVAGATLSGLVGTIDDSDLTLVVENLQYKPGDKVHVGVFLRPKRSIWYGQGR